MPFKFIQGIDGTYTLKNLTTGTDVLAVTAADLLTINNLTITMSREALAATGTDAETAAVITQQITAVTDSDGTKAVALPAAAETGIPLLVINTVTTAALPVFPVSLGNDNINGGAEDAAWTLGPGKAAWFVPVSNTQWWVEDASAVTTTTTEANLNDGQLASAAEVNRACDVSTRLVAAGGTLAVTEALHDGKTICLDTAAGSVCTLPAATGSGATFKFMVTVTPTSNSHIIKVTGNDVMYGQAFGVDGDGEPGNAWATAADSDTVNMDSSTQGGEIGDWVVVQDIAADKWSVTAWLTQGGTEATPFAATV